MDRIISDMEEGSITLIDSIILLKEGKTIVPENDSDEA
jgi:biopolymer transport protein ExbB